MVPKSRPSSENGISGTISSSRIWSHYQPDSSLLHMTQYLLGSTALFSNLVDEGDRLSNVGLDVLREFALVAEDLGAVKASDNKGEAFLLIVRLRSGWPRFSMTILQKEACVGECHLHTLTLPISRHPSSSSSLATPPSSSLTFTAAAPLGPSSKTNETAWPTYGSSLPAKDFL